MSQPDGRGITLEHRFPPMSRESSADRLLFWHCNVAAILLNQCPMNPATKHHVRSAIREATHQIRPAGRSTGAQRLRDSGRAGGLIREHAVPVSIIVGKVMELCGPWVVIDETNRAAGFVDGRVAGDINRISLGSTRRATALGHVTVEQVIALIETLAICVEITREEDSWLAGAKLRDRMPEGWDGKNLFARYEHVGIELAPPVCREEGAGPA